MAICEIPFNPSRSNFVSDAEHDTNKRKTWFLVLDGGLFTKKYDAMVFTGGDEDRIHLFSKREQAEARWAKHCRKHHDQSDAEHRDELPKRATSTLAEATPTWGPRSSPALVRGSPVHAKAPASPRKRKSSPIPLFMEDDEPDPWTRTPATPAPAPARPLTPSRASPVRTTSLRVEEAPRKAKPRTAHPLFVDGNDGYDASAPASAPPPPRADVAPPAANKGGSSVERSRAPGMRKAPGTSTLARTAAATAPQHTSTAPSMAASTSTSPRPAAAPRRTPTAPSTAASTSASPRPAAAPRRMPTAPSAAASTFASPRPAVSAVRQPAPRAETPPPVYAVESGSESSSEPTSPARTAPAPAMRDPGISPSVSSVSSLSSMGASEDLPLRRSASSASRAGLASPPAGASTASSASRPLAGASTASPASRPPAGASSAASAARAGGPSSILLFNNGTRRFYKNAAMAVDEMTDRESVEVVDYEEVGEFLSARAGRKA
ncbi:hypothetical protein B0H11DRAFT_1912511 [Mycena galericulata]|nr:hypothetical protein B0H11DRAFT_1912511 [Mycena galericulata]